VTQLVRLPEARGAIALLAELEAAGALTPTSLSLDPETPYETWEAVGGLLGALYRATAWTLGDWVEHGERSFGEKYAQAVDLTGLAPQTLMNYAAVCRAVPPERRRQALPFSSHALVAKLPAREQRRWLDRAEKQDWTRRQLSEALSGDGASETLSLREAALAVWKASKLSGRSYSVPKGPMRDLADSLGEP